MGGGPDSFLIDEVRDLLMRYSKPYTFLKLDDINNIGSLKLRVRSMIECLKVSLHADKKYPEIKLFETVPVYDSTYRNRKLLVPFFTPFLSPLIPALLNIAGYEAEGLTLSDKESSELGLRYANIEVVYPATLIVGDLFKTRTPSK